MERPLYDHSYSFGLEVISGEADGADVTGGDLRRAILNRLGSMTDEEVAEACDGGSPFDSMEVASPIGYGSVHRRANGTTAIAETICTEFMAASRGETSTCLVPCSEDEHARRRILHMVAERGSELVEVALRDLRTVDEGESVDFSADGDVLIGEEALGDGDLAELVPELEQHFSRKKA